MKSYTFQFGAATNLSSRRLQVNRINADGSRTSLHDNTEAGSAVAVDVEIADDLMCEAILTDSRAGADGVPVRLPFSTTHPQQTFYSGASTADGRLSISSWEDLSSSSSSSSDSSSSTSSDSSSSTSSDSSSSSSTSTSSASSLSSSSTSS